MENFSESSVVNLIEKISSNSPVPGGGAVSAFSASVAVALCEMAVGLAVGKKFFKEYDEEKQKKIEKIGEEAREMKGVFLGLFERDNLAFEKVMEAMKLPKNTDEEKEYRKSRIEESYIGAMEVPLEVSKKMLGFFDKIDFMVRNGNPNCITDAGVASLQAHSAIVGTIFNVKINLSGISDASLTSKVRLECDRILDEAKRIHDGILEFVNSRI